MSNNATPERPTEPGEAYPQSQRIAHAEQHILTCAGLGSDWLERTVSHRIVQTYGLPEMFLGHLKSLKAQFRNELSFGGEK